VEVAVLPEYVIEDICDFFLFISRYDTIMHPQSVGKMAPC
jgi:hypothetical protein